MWWLAGPSDIHRVSDRVSILYVERCHIDRAENAVVIVNRERTVRVPAAFVASLMVGPGSRVTHAAVRLLADSGTAMCWVGEHGVRMYAAGLGPSRSAAATVRQAALVSKTTDRLGVARQMYQMRFPGEDVSSATMQQLRGREGARVKKVYRAESARTGVPWAKRDYRPGDAFAAGDDINRALSAAHSALYGVAHAAIVGVGASPALGFVHTGSAVSFVLDIADLYKAETSVPVAFDAVAAGHTKESDVRLAMRDVFKERRLLATIVRDVLGLLGVGATQDEGDLLALWDEAAGSVPGGTNWSDSEVAAFLESGYAVLSGPELTEPEVPW
ncbi:type I-E CRISPR-associated endonuclease Cas1 [Phycicoccus sp. CSK15P-2]|uniref:type I-E CRISPR-associated endonuclease Cas1e n=1 Tax=Phycicoccus sp. CSK15P-2 TaxID=2807627 RepID=UPI0019525F0B|nr:type I-E CRISPR-associated endonuclease Cas1e [Phycicoccus sp. CSK15P-2]MBM6404830.1 type I-E CRISPR-associated endonuclease Cas1 [Phycicoccus sp. CSK15P-2]